ncbi:DeoR/GlpR family DNA-binding transcription regulator [Rossellomorea sp. DUT-2]|uniref:DeoR/GlpR family DNA-binding transcription regulator n=1 Tax=Rossellomorea sp. DUT-2 TaxID=3412021 RepID=UPI003D186ECE
MFSSERRTIILELLKEKKRILVNELAKDFNVSIDSIRRDLSHLEKEGLLQRTHGGAILKSFTKMLPPPSEERYYNIDDDMKAIAKEAVKHIYENETIYIGGASVHFAMLSYLKEHFPFTVVTNSLQIANHLRNFNNIELILIGGNLKSSGNISDSIALEMMKLFRLDKAFITGGGVTIDGIGTATTNVAFFTRQVAQQSNKVIALMHHTKINKNAFVKSIDLKEIDILITNRQKTATFIHDVKELYDLEIIKTNPIYKGDK